MVTTIGSLIEFLIMLIMPMRWVVRHQQTREDAILRELEHGPMRGHGIALMTGISHGSIYVHLNRMEQNGLIVSEEDHRPNTMQTIPHRIYQLKDTP